MAYASTTDLQSVGMPATALARFSATEQEAALEQASRTADSYLRARYTLPLASWDGDLTRVCVHIAVYDLFSAKGFNPDGPDANIRKRYEDAIAWLKAMSRFEVHPEIEDATPDESEESTVVYSDAQRGW